MLRYTNAYKFTIRGMKWVAMARHGPILKDNEAMGSGKVFKYLRGFRDIIKNSKMAAKVQKSKNAAFYRIFLYRQAPDIPPWRPLCYKITSNPSLG